MAPCTRRFNCAVCSFKLDKYEDRIICGSCAESVHLRYTGVDISEYQRMNEENGLKTWICSKCRQSKSIADANQSESAEYVTEGNDGDTVKLIRSLLTKIDYLTENIESS